MKIPLRLVQGHLAFQPMQIDRVLLEQTRTNTEWFHQIKIYVTLAPYGEIPQREVYRGRYIENHCRVTTRFLVKPHKDEPIEFDYHEPITTQSKLRVEIVYDPIHLGEQKWFVYELELSEIRSQFKDLREGIIPDR
jgi:hypothetical protein